jgi:predicted RNA-binding protein YlqC (UPF0109 family)
MDDAEEVGRMVGTLARVLVDSPDEVRVESRETDRELLFTLLVDDDDMGHVIGRGGRLAESLRQLVRAAARERDLGRVGLKIEEA